MRYLLVLALATVGCQGPGADVGMPGGPENPGGDPIDAGSSTWRFQSTLYASVSSIVLRADSDLGRAGMSYGITCDVYRSIGGIGSDYDYPTDEEEVLDVRADDVLLVGTPDRLFLDYDGTRASVGVEGLVDATFGNDTAVALHHDGACAVEFIDGSGVMVHVPVDAALCDSGELTASSTSHDAWIASDVGIVHVTPLGVGARDTTANLAVWDDTAAALYTAVSGTGAVEAREPDGTVRWSASFDGGAQQLLEMGDTGAVGVFVTHEDASGELRVYDGADGALLSTLSTVGTPDTIAVSGDGTALAVVRPNQVVFFEAADL